MQSIFTDGVIVTTFIIPKSFPSGTARTKKQWGAIALTEYVSKRFGTSNYRYVEESRSHNNSLTGTKTSVDKDGKQHVFMLVEPKGSFGEEVHVTEMEVDLEGGDILDVLDYKYSEKEPSPSPFAKLSSIKDGLPEKHNLLRVVVQKHFKSQELQLRPDYLDADPLADNSPSMRLYHLVNRKPTIEGQAFGVRIREVFNTGKKNARGAVILHLNVEAT